MESQRCIAPNGTSTIKRKYVELHIIYSHRVYRPRNKRLSSWVNVDHDVLVDVLGDRVALYGAAIINDDYKIWSLHVWNWHEGQQAHVGIYFRASFTRFLSDLLKEYMRRRRRPRLYQNAISC
jgi:hypothetical protein